jgi:hypothetical protein
MLAAKAISNGMFRRCWLAKMASCIGQNSPWLPGKLGRLGCRFGMRMNFGQGKMPEREAQAAAVASQKLPNDRLSGRTERALVVAVLHDHDSHIIAADNMVKRR